MKETFEKEEAIHIEVTDTQQNKALINKTEIAYVVGNLIYMKDKIHFEALESYEEIKQKLGVK